MCYFDTNAMGVFKQGRLGTKFAFGRNWNFFKIRYTLVGENEKILASALASTKAASLTGFCTEDEAVQARDERREGRRPFY